MKEVGIYINATCSNSYDLVIDRVVEVEKISWGYADMIRSVLEGTSNDFQLSHEAKVSATIIKAKYPNECFYHDGGDRA